MAAPITERIYFLGNQLVVEDCDGNKVYLDVPCTCGDNPDGDGGEYPPPYTAGDLCALANFYTVPVYNIMSYLQDPALAVHLDNFQGWQRACAQTAVEYDLSATFINVCTARLATTPYRENFIEVLLPRDLSPQAAATYQTVCCIIYACLIDGFGVLNYDIVRAKFQAAGMIGFGQMMTAVPLAEWNKKAFFYAAGQVTDEYYIDIAIDCAECDDTPPDPGTTCEDCEINDCIMFRASAIANPGVSGYDNVGLFASGTVAYWFAENGTLTFDLGSNRCIKKVLVRNYTPQGAGGTNRSNMVRFEVDNVPVSEFRGQTFGATNYGECAVENDFVTSLPTLDGLPRLGRYVRIVGNEDQEYIVQVSFIVCPEE